MISYSTRFQMRASIWRFIDSKTDALFCKLTYVMGQISWSWSLLWKLGGCYYISAWQRIMAQQLWIQLLRLLSSNLPLGASHSLGCWCCSQALFQEGSSKEIGCKIIINLLMLELVCALGNSKSAAFRLACRIHETKHIWKYILVCPRTY